jgi:hypothetical protein
MAKILMMAGSIIVVLSLLGFLVLLLKGRAVEKMLFPWRQQCVITHPDPLATQPLLSL